MTDADGAQLGETPIFSDLPEEDIATFRQFAKRLDVAAGDWLFRQGDEADCFYVVLTGRLDLEVRTSTGTEHVVAQMGPGSVVGETSLFIGGQRSASALATEPTSLLRFHDQELCELLRADSLPAYRVAYKLGQAMAQRLREVDAHIAQMSSNGGGQTTTEDDIDRLRRIFFADWGAAAPRGRI